jgi:Spx/MgsR family transcriptional regulator
MTMYGISNCDTIKKARAWLEARRIAYAFHDYKKAGVDGALLEAWCRELGWERLCNRAGTTFRKLPESETRDLDGAKALALMQAHPSIIKRPVLVMDGQVIVGFTPETYARVVRP